MKLVVSNTPETAFGIKMHAASTLLLSLSSIAATSLYESHATRPCAQEAKGTKRSRCKAIAKSRSKARSARAARRKARMMRS